MPEALISKSINIEKASRMVHILIERCAAEGFDMHIGGIILLRQNHNRTCLDYLRDKGIGIRHRHTPSERRLTFRNTKVSVLRDLLETGQLGDVHCIYAGPFGKRNKKDKKKGKGRRANRR